MDSKSNFHTPVMLSESINLLNIKKNKIFVDCTFGRGGHSLEILNKLDNTGFLYCFDKDVSAEKYFKDNFFNFKNCKMIKSDFRFLKSKLNDLNIYKVDGFLFDLGVSSPMLDNASRGFSYKLNSRLDMRMDTNQKLDAHFIINNYEKKELIRIFKDYGEIKNSYLVVENIIKKRKIKPINTTLELVEIIREKTPIKFQFLKKHFARLYFQALRIEVNDEINALKNALKNALEMLNINGRIVTISFHSLEEKTIKEIYNQKILEMSMPKEIPILSKTNFKIINTNKNATKEEINKNIRSRSSQIKVIERVN